MLITYYARCEKKKKKEISQKIPRQRAIMMAKHQVLLTNKFRVNFICMWARAEFMYSKLKLTKLISGD